MRRHVERGRGLAVYESREVCGLEQHRRHAARHAEPASPRPLLRPLLTELGEWLATSEELAAVLATLEPPASPQPVDAADLESAREQLAALQVRRRELDASVRLREMRDRANARARFEEAMRLIGAEVWSHRLTLCDLGGDGAAAAASTREVLEAALSRMEGLA
jgi:hypothetical protein